MANSKNNLNYAIFVKQNERLAFVFETKCGIVLYFTNNLKFLHNSKNEKTSGPADEHEGQGRQALTEPTQGWPALDMQLPGLAGPGYAMARAGRPWICHGQGRLALVHALTRAG